MSSLSVCLTAFIHHNPSFYFFCVRTEVSTRLKKKRALFLESHLKKGFFESNRSASSIVPRARDDMSTSKVIVLLQQIIVSLAVDQYSHSTPIMLEDESSTAERQHFWNSETEELLLDAVMKSKAHLSEHGKVTTN